MPYPMTHLYIAKKLLDKCLYSIKNKSQYYLGNLVPDAVEFSQTIYDKKISHLCNDKAKWGFIMNYEKWIKDVLEYYKQNIKTNDYNFFIGYCIHVSADINYSNKIWTPFRLENERKNFDEVYKISHDESNAVDLELYQKCEFKNEIWELLNESICINFMDKVKKEEMEKMKDNVLNIQYKNKPLINSENNKIITYNGLLEYINNTIEYIEEQIIKKI